MCQVSNIVVSDDYTNMLVNQQYSSESILSCNSEGFPIIDIIKRLFEVNKACKYMAATIYVIINRLFKYIQADTSRVLSLKAKLIFAVRFNSHSSFI